MSSVDYKMKYLDLRSKLLDATDVSYRLGYEDGMREGQQAAQQQVQQQQMEQEAAMMQAQQGGEMPPGVEGEMPPEGMEGQPPEGVDEESGSDLDSHIDELQSLVAKGEKPSVVQLRNKIIELTDLRKSQKAKFQNKTAKNVTAQKKVVDSILKKWENESKDVTEGLEKIIKESGIRVE